MINWKKIALHLLLLLFVSLASTLTTWYVLTQREVKQPSWKELLRLTPEQEKKFLELESDFNFTLKEITVEDAQNRISLCSYLHQDESDPEKLKLKAKEMALTYQKKQEKIAATLAAISNFLTPEQRKTFSHKLMQETCVWCQKAVKNQKCLCGMCESHA
ncbi:MAG: Spy/CpxP family protein refolding chaperone [Elusimicrobia bacterium]|nr:Spy/CpxP family protein refolding chaperone [Elusimicrobiota bacterium]